MQHGELPESTIYSDGIQDVIEKEPHILELFEQNLSSIGKHVLLKYFQSILQFKRLSTSDEMLNLATKMCDTFFGNESKNDHIVSIDPKFAATLLDSIGRKKVEKSMFDAVLPVVQERLETLFEEFRTNYIYDCCIDQFSPFKRKSKVRQ